MKKTEVSMWRYNFLRVGMIIAALVIITRLFQIQVLNTSRYRAQAREQHWEGYPISAKRGTIYSSDDFPLAMVNTTYTLFIDTQKYIRSLDLYAQLTPIIPDLSKSDIEKIISTDKKWIKVVDGLSWNQKGRIDAKKIPGLVFEENYSRFYPEGEMLGNVLGFLGSDSQGNTVGYYGLEQYYDGDLKGQDGWLFQEKSALGDPILWGEVERVNPINGSNLYLTIDRGMQFIVEKKISKGVEKYGAKAGLIIVVEPSTGKILAMANFPSLNPNKPDDDKLMRNPSISEVYEPGSVMKGITMASAFDEGVVTSESTYNDTGPRIFSGHKVDNWDGKHHGVETMTSILQHSNNLGAAWVGLQLGGTDLVKYFKAFGFGKKLGIDIEGEEVGILHNASSIHEIAIANMSFGQGISVTPIQLVMAFSSIANGGELMKPYLVTKIQNSEEASVINPIKISRVIKSDVAQTVEKMLINAVSGGEAQFFVSKNFVIAGKTGTAQIPVKGGYDKNRTNATFVGYFPTYKNFVMLIKLEEPTFPSGYSAETAVPLWMETAEELAGYLGLRPDKFE